MDPSWMWSCTGTSVSSFICPRDTVSPPQAYHKTQQAVMESTLGVGCKWWLTHSMNKRCRIQPVPRISLQCSEKLQPELGRSQLHRSHSAMLGELFPDTRVLFPQYHTENGFVTLTTGLIISWNQIYPPKSRQWRISLTDSQTSKSTGMIVTEVRQNLTVNSKEGEHA